MITDVRRMSANLRPVALDLFGLITALRILCEEVQKAHKTCVIFETTLQGETRYDAQVEIALYRIAQEALNNAAKHSGAARVALNLANNNGNIILTVQDNGKGFVTDGRPHPTSLHDGFGLVSMRDRAELLGGTFRIESTPDVGTTVYIELPLNKS